MIFGINNLWAKIPPEKIPGSTKVDDKFWDYLKEEDDVLEVGCGKGRFVYNCAARGLNVVGIDINKETIKKLKEDAWLFGAEVYHANILKAKFKKKFKGVLMQGLLSSLKKRHRMKCLKKVKSIMKDGGYIHVAEFEMDDRFEKRYDEDFKLTHEYGTLSIKDKDSGKELCRSHNFRKKEITKLIEEAGFEIIRFKKTFFTSYHGEKKPGMMIIARS